MEVNMKISYSLAVLSNALSTFCFSVDASVNLSFMVVDEFNYFCHGCSLYGSLFLCTKAVMWNSHFVC